MALVGRYGLLEYDVGGPRLWHERWILEHIANEEYVVVTPDSDVYVEDLSLLNGDLRGIRIRPADGVVPAGVAANQIYGLPAWNAGEQAALRAEATRVAQQERQLRGGAGAAAPAAVAVPAVVGGGGGGGDASNYPAGTLRWLAAESLGDRDYGSEVVGVSVPKTKGAKHVMVATIEPSWAKLVEVTLGCLSSL